MLEILKDGLIESDDKLSVLTQSYGQIVIPNEDENLEAKKASSVDFCFDMIITSVGAGADSRRRCY